jgi:hypothetical protein
MGGSRYRTRDRARETEDAVTGFLAENGWPQAARVGPFQPGADVTGTPGLRFEVKARRDLRLTEWLEQAGPRPLDGAVMIGAVPKLLPVVVHRPDGWGPAKVGLWPATTRLEDLVALLRLAGYGAGGQDQHPWE